MSKCRETFFVDIPDLQAPLAGQKASAEFPAQHSETESQWCASDKMSRLWVQPKLMTFPAQLLCHHPSHHLIQLQSFPRDWQQCHKTRKDWDDCCSPAALTQLGCEPALVPAPALQKEQGSAHEIGLCSFWIGTEMLKSKEICWKDCVRWEGELYAKGIGFSYLNAKREQGLSLFSNIEFPVNSLTNCERYIKIL